MLSQYLPILVFIVLGLILGLVMLGAGALLSKHDPYPVKNAPYECGFNAFESSHIPFDVRFYLVAILFIIFDLETAFFVPWALVLRKIGWFGFSAMMIFLGLLVIGFIYEWKRGALEWE
ncbi:NADH-quinone oxidoreductase subunit A [Legionella jordanis]|uniref:NADH-quinone oxidoreductase subunit A n=1 Tax=Legionella jordanis TaxID=456 RepID=A0A0W0VDE4_9GAMM|nr:NADH-quinone oxidoreductase subunit A [Legionella jordanis]KTD18126.1 NADH dehydrogenase I chain A [Legionella jordanis]RMX00564.1 NADH-quinone oxidoreductase subunit A [Legionella jordanis]RMX21319.1 NADH-quinone oxidoreductase subunit A [Legionella jordanis]VEH13781.1 NADH dehydrogenase I subunit A [Legionella jordanis]